MLPYMKFPLFTEYMFLNPMGEKGDIYNFCTDIEKIGIEFDVALQNGSFIDVISEPVEINHPKYGVMTISKIKADVAIDYHTVIKEFWIPTAFIVKLEAKELN